MPNLVTNLSALATALLSSCTYFSTAEETADFTVEKDVRYTPDD
jgi:hypothetical protein